MSATSPNKYARPVRNVFQFPLTFRPLLPHKTCSPPSGPIWREPARRLANWSFCSFKRAAIGSMPFDRRTPDRERQKAISSCTYCVHDTPQLIEFNDELVQPIIGAQDIRPSAPFCEISSIVCVKKLWPRLQQAYSCPLVARSIDPIVLNGVQHPL